MSNRLGKERETDVLPANMEYQNICIYILDPRILQLF